MDIQPTLLKDYSIQGKHLIDGTWCGEGESYFEVLSPVNHDVLGPRFLEASGEQVSRAVELAHNCFLQGEELSIDRRAQLLDALASALEVCQEPLLARCMAETAYPLPRAKGELIRTIHQTREFAELLREGSWVDARLDTALPERRPLARPDLRSMLRPLGVVGVIGASNFPFAISVVGTDTVTALASGCPVVVKGHPGHPGTCEMLAEIVRETLHQLDLPQALFSLVQGRNHEVGKQLVSHPRVRAIAFTGGEEGGRAICRIAAQRDEPIPVFAEMGSVNPVVVLPKAAELNGSRIVEGFLQSLLLGGGQFCTNPGLLFIPETKAGDELLLSLQSRFAGVESPTLLNHRVAADYREGVAARECLPNVDTLRSGVEVSSSSGVLPMLCVVAASDLTPTLLTEVFGPFSVVARWRDMEDLISAVRKLSGQLTATVHCSSDDTADCDELTRELQWRAGRFVMNGYPTGVEPSYAMHHGGPFPAASLPHFTSIGMGAMKRFVRPLCYQDVPDELLPRELQDSNPLGLMRLVDGRYSREGVTRPLN